jgi:hypothetical protein
MVTADITNTLIDADGKDNYFILTPEPRIFIILYNEPTNAQLIDNYYTAPTCFDTTLSSSGSS